MKVLNVFMLVAVLLVSGGYSALAAGDAAKGKQVYTINCTACHNFDPSKPGALGPEVKGSPKALIAARVLSASYPKGYKPKRNTKLMVALPHLKGNIDDLAAYLK